MKRLLLFALAAGLHGQTCNHQVTRSPFGPILVYQNGVLLAQNTGWFYLAAPAGTQPTLSPASYFAGDSFTATFDRAVSQNVTLGGVPFKYNIYQTWVETWTCATGNKTAAPPVWILPPATFASPPVNPPVNAAYLFTDASAAFSCQAALPSDPGIARQICYWDGAAWQPTDNTNPPIFDVGNGLVISSMQCVSNLVDFTALNTFAAGQTEITILPSLSSDFRYHHVSVSERVQFVGMPADFTVSMGRPGTNNYELTGVQVPLGISSGDFNNWFARPVPPQTNGAYAVVLNFNSGSGLLTSLTAGSLKWEICGFSSANSTAPAAPKVGALKVCSGSGVGPDGVTGWNCAGLYQVQIMRADGSILPIVGPSMVLGAPAPGVVWTDVK